MHAWSNPLRIYQGWFGSPNHQSIHLSGHWRDRSVAGRSVRKAVVAAAKITNRERGWCFVGRFGTSQFCCTAAAAQQVTAPVIGRRGWMDQTGQARVPSRDDDFSVSIKFFQLPTTFSSSCSVSQEEGLQLSPAAPPSIHRPVCMQYYYGYAHFHSPRGTRSLNSEIIVFLPILPFRYEMRNQQLLGPLSCSNAAALFMPVLLPFPNGRKLPVHVLIGPAIQPSSFDRKLSQRTTGYWKERTIAQAIDGRHNWFCHRLCGDNSAGL